MSVWTLWASDQEVRPCAGFSYEASDFSCVAGDEPHLRLPFCWLMEPWHVSCSLQVSYRMKRILLDAHVCHDLLGREYLSMRQSQWSANQHVTIFTIKSRSNSDQIQIMFHHQVPIKSRSSPVSSSTIKSQSSWLESSPPSSPNQVQSSLILNTGFNLGVHFRTRFRMPFGVPFDCFSAPFWILLGALGTLLESG